MKTEVILKRELFGVQISQKSKSEFFNVTELVKAGNKWKRENNLPPFNLSQYINSKPFKEFQTTIEKKYGKCLIVGRGRNSSTWVHPLLFIDIALAINPNLKLEVYEWILDNLVKYRNDSGDSYRKMCGYLWQNYQNKQKFPKFIQSVARSIQIACEVKDWNKATENQLKMRDKIHDNICLLCNVLRNTKQAVYLGIKESMKEFNII